MPDRPNKYLLRRVDGVLQALDEEDREVLEDWATLRAEEIEAYVTKRELWKGWFAFGGTISVALGILTLLLVLTTPDGWPAEVVVVEEVVAPTELSWYCSIFSGDRVCTARAGDYHCTEVQGAISCLPIRDQTPEDFSL